MAVDPLEAVQGMCSTPDLAVAGVLAGFELGDLRATASGCFGPRSRSRPLAPWSRRPAVRVRGDRGLD